MMTIDYLKQSNLQECYEIHSHFFRDWTIGDFAHFDTIDEAIAESEKRLEDKSVRKVEIRRFFKKDGNIYYDGKTHWEVNRK